MFVTDLTRAVERPPPTVALKHELHSDVRRFAETGRILPSSMAYMPLFAVLRRTATGREFGVVDTETSVKVFASADFAATVNTKWSGGARSRDVYQRPVQWYEE